MPLPDRQACLLAAANAAASWARTRRTTWTDKPVAIPTTTRRTMVVPPVDNAVAEALLSTLSLDGPSPELLPTQAVQQLADEPAAQRAETEAVHLPELDATTQPAAFVAAPLPVPANALPTIVRVEVDEPAAVHHVHEEDVPQPMAATSEAVRSPLPLAAHAIERHEEPEVTPVEKLENVEAEPAVLASTLDIEAEEAFAPLLARDRSAFVEPTASVLDEGTQVGIPHDAAVAPALEPSVEIPASEITAAVPKGPSVVALWARSVGSAVGSWWPQVAMVAVVLVLGATARVYLPKLMAPKPGVAVLESVPDGSQVLVDGKALGTTPFTATLPAGDHSVEFRFRKATRTVRLSVTAGGHTTERVDWTKKPNGRLQVHTDPPGAKVLVDGVDRGVTPLTLDDLAVGAHALVLQRADGSIQRTVTVSATEIARVNEMIFPGWVTVFSPFTLNITEGSRPIRLDDRNQVMLPSGAHDLRFENRALGYEEVRHVDVRSGAVTTLSIVPPHSSLTVSSTVPAEVLLDGVSAGQTPLTALPVELGTREVVVRNAEGEVRRFTTTITTKPVTLEANFSKPAQ